MQEPGRGQKRIEVPYFEGVNSLVGFNIAKNTELIHAENARSRIIGTIEKREGQTVLGKNINDEPFVTTANYGIFSFQNSINQGFYRISVAENPLISINITETLYVSDVQKNEFVGISNLNLLPLTLNVGENINIKEQVNNNTGNFVTIYFINSNNQWVPLVGNGANIPGGIFDYTYAEGCVFLVNFNSNNRYINSDTTTVTDSSDGTGHLFNSPPASRINFYKNRLYLADFTRSGVRYKTTVLRSSYPMGIIALVNTDTTIAMDNNGLYNFVSANAPRAIAIAEMIYTSEAVNNLPSGPSVSPAHKFGYSYNTVTGLPATLEVTDTKYFYTDSGANTYDVYRGGLQIATLTVVGINQTSIIVNVAVSYATESLTLLASDEIWVSGTFYGKKIFRWVNNASITGRDIKQYDTFKLSGGENDAITMLTNVGNIMIVANKSAITSWNDYTLENFDLDVGCVSKKGYIKMLGTLYFMHYTGIYATNGSVPQLISNKIEKYITGATKIGLENSAAGKKGRSIFFTLGDVNIFRPDGSLEKQLKDVCVEYHITQSNWYIHTNVKASEFATFVESFNANRLEFTDTAGNHAVKEFLSGETDDENIIPFRMDTQKLILQSDNFEFSSNLVSLLIEVERGSGSQVFLRLDNDENYYPIEGKITKGLSILKINNKDVSRGKPPVCRLVSVSIRDSSRSLCKFSRMTLVTIPSTQDTRDNENLGNAVG